MKRKIFLYFTFLIIVAIFSSMSFAAERPFSRKKGEYDHDYMARMRREASKKMPFFQKAKMYYYMEEIRKATKEKGFEGMNLLLEMEEWGDASCAPILIEVLKGNNPGLFTNAIFQIGQFKRYIEKDPELLKEIIPLLIQFLRDDTESLRGQARNALLQFQGRPNRRYFPKEEIEQTVQEFTSWWEENKEKMLTEAKKREKALEEKRKQEEQPIEIIKKENYLIAVCFLPVDPQNKEWISLSKKMEDSVRNSISEMSNIQLLEWAKTNLLIEERNLSQLALTDVISKAKGLGVDYFILGIIYQERGEIILESELLDVYSERFISLYKGEADLDLAQTEIMKRVDELFAESETREEKENLASKQVNLAIMDLQTYGGDKENLGEILTSFLIQHLSGIEDIKIVSRQEIKNVLKEFERQKSGLSETENLKIGRLLNADVIVLGNYETKDKDILVRVRLVETNTGKIIGVASASGNSENLGNLQKDLSLQIVNQLKAEERSVSGRDNKELARVYFNNALDAIGYKDPEKSLLWIENAIFLDPELLEAQDLDARFNWLKKNYSKAIEKYRYLISKYPQEKAVPDWLYSLGCIYFSQGEKEKAIECFKKIINKYPHYDVLRDNILFRVIRKKYYNIDEWDGSPLSPTRETLNYERIFFDNRLVPKYFPMFWFNNNPAWINPCQEIAYGLAKYYKEQKSNSEQALKFYLLSIEFALSGKGSSWKLTPALHTSAQIYEQKGNIPKALEFYRKALEKAKAQERYCQARSRSGVCKPEREICEEIEEKIKELEK